MKKSLSENSSNDIHFTYAKRSYQSHANSYRDDRIGFSHEDGSSFRVSARKNSTTNFRNDEPFEESNYDVPPGIVINSEIGQKILRNSRIKPLNEEDATERAVFVVETRGSKVKKRKEKKLHVVNPTLTLDNEIPSNDERQENDKKVKPEMTEAKHHKMCFIL